MTDYPFNLGAVHRPAGTANTEAQTWFDRGLAWLWGFHHEEAITCFERAAEIDPACAMAHWGVAYASGPNYNVPWERMDDLSTAKALGRAHRALERARDCFAEGPDAALIAALGARYPQAEPAPDQQEWDHNFANAMRGVAAAYPEDLDIQAVFADSILNLTPWQMWDLHDGTPAPDTLEVRTALEEARAYNGLSLIHVPVYCGADPLGGMGAHGSWNVGNWVGDVQARYIEQNI